MITEALDVAGDDSTRPILRRIADQLDLVSKDLGAIQLANLSQPQTAPTEQHYLFPIPLSTPAGPHTAQLKVYRRPGESAIDPKNVRLALLLDLPELGQLAISLTVFERHIGGQILSADPQTRQLVDLSLDQLVESLHNLGYTVNNLSSDLLLAEPAPAPENEAQMIDLDLSLPQINVRA